MLETNKHPRSVCLQHFLGERGLTADENGVVIQIQNTIVSSKALVLVNCFNTFVHDCRSEMDLNHSAMLLPDYSLLYQLVVPA